MNAKRFHSVKGNIAPTFSLADYDCVGFDLDHTLCAYHLGPLSDLIYRAVTSFLVEKRGYPRELATAPLDLPFMQKGLILDKQRGNILKLDAGYRISRATHGTRPMSRSDVERVYGSDSVWGLSREILTKSVEAGALQEPFYTFKDYFGTTGVFVCARIVDVLDKQNGSVESYTFWKDYLDGLHYIYDRKNFKNGEGGFFSELVSHPEQYLVPCSDGLKGWLRALRSEGKTIFLVTSSNHDSAEFLSKYCLGEGWRGFFDLVVTFARKPRFFRKEAHPFLLVREGREVVGDVDPASMGHHEIYSEGNFEGLRTACAAISGKKNPRMLYFGDSLIEDIYAASERAGCDTVAIVEEISKDEEPSVWGSFFRSDASGRPENGLSLWAHLLAQHSRVAIEDLESLSRIGIHERIPSFGSPLSGYFPVTPKALSS